MQSFLSILKTTVTNSIKQYQSRFNLKVETALIDKIDKI